MNILVVEDDPISRKVVAKTLERLGHHVTVCNDGDEGWQSYQEGDFPVVISDWMMPGTDGLELCRKIRRQSSHDYCFFILLTARSSKSDYLAAIWAGVDDYLTKPIIRNELEMRLRVAQRHLTINSRRASLKMPLELLKPVRSM
jgi:DNA-binding response OmpR family regulator